MAEYMPKSHVGLFEGSGKKDEKSQKFLAGTALSRIFFYTTGKNLKELRALVECKHRKM